MKVKKITTIILVMFLCSENHACGRIQRRSDGGTTLKNRIAKSLGNFALPVVFLALMAFSLPLLAVQDQVGPYQVNVDVRNSVYLMVPQALVKCSPVGQNIRVSVSAPGYVPQVKEIRTVSGTSSYFITIRLADREKRIDILDYNYKPIVSAYIDRFQGGTPSHLYAINLMLPVKTWPHPNAGNVKVNQPGYGWPIQLSCDISLFEDFYRVRMLIDRAVLDDPKDHLLVYVDTAEDAVLRRRFNEQHRDNEL